jgi:hypothetical protein
MSTGTHRAIELVVGFAMIGYCAYAAYTGSIQGRFRCYTRSEHPWPFWVTVLIAFFVGVAFILGHVSWRH